jgi:glycosyltransferase involved in cell wall biosynthesis
MRIIARLNVGGPTIHVTLLTAGLPADEFRTILVTGLVGKQEGDMSYFAHDAGIRPLVIPSLGREISFLQDIHTVFALIRLMRAERPHIVHTHTAKAGLVGRIAAFLCGVPVIIHTFHGHVFKGYFAHLKSALFLWLERLVACLTDIILTISDSLRAELIDYRIAAPDRIRVLPLGLPLNLLADLTKLRGQFREELGCSTDAPLIGIIGRLVPIKNHALFLEAAQLVHETQPGTQFVIVGGGEMEESLHTKVAQLGLGAVFSFTGWRNDLPRVYADLDLVVISSDNEGTPVSLIEAMAAGVPVVSTAVGGVGDLLHGGDFGMIVPPGDHQALAQAMLQVLRTPDPERLQAARQHVLTLYDEDRLLHDIRALYIEQLELKGLMPVQPVEVL